MDSQSSIPSLAERLGGSRREKLRDHHKEHRLSKADIGGPIPAHDNKIEMITPESLGAPTMVLRCVIIQRDEKGYGLTVSGDNPVYVQSVKEYGAAYTAGVQQGDRIIKVNGTNVTDYNHIEVVKLIKSESYVALTLLGPPLAQGETTGATTTSNTAAPVNSYITQSRSKLLTDNSFLDEKVNTIKKMLEQERAEVERIKEEYAKDPNKKLLEELGVAQKMMQDLEKQLWKAESKKQNSLQDIPIQDFHNRDTSSEMEENLNLSRDDSSGSRHSINIDERRTLHPEQGSIKDMKTSNMNSIDDTHVSLNSSDVDSPNPNVSNPDDGGSNDSSQQHNHQIMNFEEDELADESNAYKDHGPFKDFDILRTRPAHMAVFINYVFRKHDPCYLLLSLTVDNFRQLTSSKEMTKLSDNICKNYLLPNSPMKVNIDEGIAKSIVDAVHSKNLPEDTLRTVFDPAVQHAMKAIRSQLQQFCNKREQGLSNCFGEDKISPVMEHSQEIKVVEEVLTPLMQDLGSPTANSDETETQKMNAKMDALEKFVIQLTGKRKSKLTSRIGSMLRPNRPNVPMRPKTAGSMESILDEQNKRMSILGKWGGKKTKRGESSSTARETSKRDKALKGSKEHSLSSLSENTVHISTTEPPSVISGDRSPHSKAQDIPSGRPKCYSDSVLGTSAPGPAIDYTIFETPNSASPSISRRQRKTVIPVVQSSHMPEMYPTESGIVSQMVKQFQDGTDSGTLPNVQEGNEGGLTVKKDKNIGRSGSFRSERRQRSATGKSNSDPDVNTVESVVAQINSDISSAEYSQMSSSVSNSSMTSAGTGSISGSVTSGSLAEDLITPLIANHPELDVEPESHWSANAPRDVIKSLDKKECKRQEIINELLHTERHHVRDLVILDLLFYKAMENEGLLNTEDLFLVFPNLQEMLRMHRQLNNGLKELKERDGHVIKDIADILLATFDGPEGNKFKEECAKYCGNQTAALEFIKERCKKDQKFNNFIQTTERHPICRRLRLKDFVPGEFQRLTKYPLLLENIIKNTKKKDEANKLRKAQKQCKEILNYVNKAVKDAEDHQKIVEIQKNLDASSLQKVNHPIVKEYKNINLVERTLVHQGPLTWRITQTEKKKSVVLHCVLFKDIMVLLQKQDERYVLKCHASTTNSTKDEKSTVQPPILKLSKVIVRNVATDKRAFFLVSMSEFGPQIYELVATTTHEMQEWMRIVSSTTEIAKKKEASGRRDGFMVAESSKSHKKPNLRQKDEQLEAIEDENEDKQRDRIDGVLLEELVDDVGILQKIQIKHEEISAALVFKHNLLAAYAGIEASELENVLDMSLMDSEVDSKTLVMRSLNSAQKLTSIVNDLLQPDTVFLQPYQQPVLLPTSDRIVDESMFNSDNEPVTPTPTMQSDTTSPATPTAITMDDLKTPTPDAEAEQSESSEVTGDERWAVPPPDNQLLSTPSTQEDIVDSVTPDRRSNASLEFIMSDYETASEPNSPSPSSTEEQQSSAENDTDAAGPESEEQQQPDEPTIDVDQDTSTSHSDAGIGLSESRNDMDSDNTISATENSVSDMPSSPMINLLDFGPALSPPDITLASSPTGKPNAEVLMANTTPISVTKILQVTHSLETQLQRLLRVVTESEEEKQRLLEENARLISQSRRTDSIKSSENTSTLPTEPGQDNTEQGQEIEGEVLPSYAEIVSDCITTPTSPIPPQSPRLTFPDAISPPCGYDASRSESHRFTFGNQENAEPSTIL